MVQMVNLYCVFFTKIKSEVLVTAACTVACQAPLSMEFSRQKYGMDCYSLLQGIFLTQGLNPALLHCRQAFNHLSHQGNPLKLKRKIKKQAIQLKLNFR